MKWSDKDTIVSLSIILAFVVSYILMALGLIDKGIWAVVVFTMSIGFLANYYIQRFRSKKKGQTPVDTSKYEHPETRKLVTETLQRMNCKVDTTDEGNIIFEYQGVTFMIEATDDCLFINLIWPWCYTIHLYDANEYSCLRKVVNDLNAHSACSVFYYPHKETDEMVVHMKKNMLFVSDITSLDAYLSSAITGLFSTARQLDLDMEKMRVQEHEAQMQE